MAYEELAYEKVQTYSGFELRRYAPHVVAEVRVRGSFDSAGNRAFGSLFGYISGRNRRRALSADVPEPGTKIAMTIPVLQAPDSAEDHYTISFVMPSEHTLDSLPLPIDKHVKLRHVPERLMAALAYTGGWNQANYRRHERQLLQAVADAGLQSLGEPVYARHNGPFTLWFMRHNEVLVEVTPIPVPAV